MLKFAHNIDIFKYQNVFESQLQLSFVTFCKLFVIQQQLTKLQVVSSGKDFESDNEFCLGKGLWAVVGYIM